MGGFWGILKRERYYGRRFTSKHELVQMIQQDRTYLPQYTKRKGPKSLKTVRRSARIHFVISRSCVRVTPPAPKSIENFGFRCFFVAKTLKKVWVKMWVNCLTHTETHTRKYPDRSKEYRRGSFCLLSGIFAFSAYMTCAMKLPIVCAASSCFCLVAWV
jgi:hypothetical protein